MYGQIKKANYLKISVDKKNFILLQKQKILQITFNQTQKCNAALQVENEFVRAIWKDWYLDITITQTVREENITVHLGKVIDYNKPHK